MPRIVSEAMLSLCDTDGKRVAEEGQRGRRAEGQNKGRIRVGLKMSNS